MMGSRLLWAVALVGALGIAGARSSHAGTIAIDLNDFFADPTVDVATGGGSALLEEDALLSPVLLANDPGLGEPEVVLAGAGVELVFDYEFDEGPTGENDEFGAFLIDASSGLPVGSPFDFFATASASGEVRWSLSSLTSYTLGVQFQLSALPGDLGLASTVGISNLRLEGVADLDPDPDPDPRPVPEPASIALCGLALGVGGAVRRRRRAA